MFKKIFCTVLPGGGLIVLAFIFASNSNVFLGLIGFLAFFTSGITIIVEGLRSKHK